jgi:hypothetical protein
MKRCISIAIVVLAAHVSTPAHAAINLELRPVLATVDPGDTIEIGLYAVSDDPEASQFLFAMEVLFAWDADAMQLLGLDQTGAVPSLASGFAASGDHGLNEEIPPQDGDGFYLYFAPLGTTAEATPAGALITTFQYLALAPTPAATMTILRSGGGPPPGQTFVVGETGGDVTGTLGSASVEITGSGSGCAADITGPDGSPDGNVDALDFLLLISQWGSPGNCAMPPCAADITGPGGPGPDGNVDALDFLLLISQWGNPGNCPS